MELAGTVIDITRAQMGATIPLAPVDASTWLRAVGLMIAIGLIVGALPAIRGMRLRIVDALAGR
jgi:putative ABC transport system permease protein